MSTKVPSVIVVFLPVVGINTVIYLGTQIKVYLYFQNLVVGLEIVTQVNCTWNVPRAVFRELCREIPILMKNEEDWNCITLFILLLIRASNIKIRFWDKNEA